MALPFTRMASVANESLVMRDSQWTPARRVRELMGVLALCHSARHTRNGILDADILREAGLLIELMLTLPHYIRR